MNTAAAARQGMRQIGVFVAIAHLAFGQGPTRQELADLDWGRGDGVALTQPLRERAMALTEAEAAALHKQLQLDPGDLTTRMVLLFRELPDARKKRGKRPDPKPHGQLVLGLIEEHPRSDLAASAGFLLYPYKRDGMYSGPAWEEAISIWERLAAKYPEDAAIASNAGAFLMADPFRMDQDGPRALELLQRARALDPASPKWALRLGSFHALNQRMSRQPEARTAAAKSALEHLRAGWDLTAEPQRASLYAMGMPLAMALASACFDAGDAESAQEFALLAIAGLDPKAPRGDLVYEMNVLLGRLALDRGEKDSAGQYLLAAGKTVGSPVLGSFGPDLTLAKRLFAAGERDVVVEFLHACRSFWDTGDEDLAAWIETILAGGDPWND